MATFGSGFGSGGFGNFGQRSDAGSGNAGFGFGAPSTAVATAPSSSFNFGGLGTTATTGGFGGFTNPAAGQSLFGTQQPTTTASTGFGGYSFGSAAPAVTSAAVGGFGSGFSFGTTANTLTTTASTGFGGFNMGGSTVPTTTAGFGGFGGFGAQPATSTAANTGFGGGFNFGGGGFGGQPATTSSLGTGFGGGMGLGMTQSGGLFGKPAIGQPAVSSNEQNIANLMAALFYPVLYGDERDTIIAKWNQLQAHWGTGSGFYAIGAPPIVFTPENFFCKFKAVGYSCIPTSKNESGLVSMVLDKSDIDIRTLQPQLVDALSKVLGSQPTLSVCVDGVKPSADNKSEVTIYVLERAPTGLSRRVLASDLYNFFSQPNIKQQLSSFGVEKVIPKVKPTAEQLRHYLDNPQSGIDQMVWQQACKDNPDQEKFIPVPMVGFAELNRRLKQQEEETKVHDNRLELIGNELTELQNKLISREAKISDYKRKHLELCHRILKVMIKHEISRKLGLALQADEEQLRVKLESISTELSAPNQAKGRLNELMAQIRLQKENFLNFVRERYNVDPTLQDELKRHLRKQQEGLIHLVNVLKNDFEYLKLVEGKLKEEPTHK